MSRVTVVGDLLLDRDVVGTVTRICPDAPAPVLDVQRETARPGGAGLAAMLLAGDGHDVRLLCAVGDDDAGREVTGLLRDHGVEVLALPSGEHTRVKTRVRAGDQSLVRVDHGTTCAPGDVPASTLDAALRDTSAVLVSDYAGGVTAHLQVRAALTSARAPLVWDPHPRGARPVAGARVVTPNESEAAVLAGDAAAGQAGLAAAADRADRLREDWQAHAVCVTLGERGALLTQGAGAPEVVPAPAAAGGDTCGAGDRFASAVTAALASGDMVSGAVEHGVACASAFVRAGGAAGLLSAPTDSATPQPALGCERVEAVRARGGTVVATGGCFDLLHAGHVGLLRAARALGDCLVVCLNSDDSVRRLKGPQRPLVPEADRARVLEALEYVDAVVTFDEDTPASALRTLRPDVWVKGGDYALTDLPEATDVASWGGQCVVLPYLTGRSTTTLIDAARGHVTKETR